MVRFLHLGDKPITSWYEERAGVGFRNTLKPNGFWMARDLTWVALMDKVGQWTPRPTDMLERSNPPGQILAAFSHVFAGKPVPSPAEGETLDVLWWPPLYVYEVDIPDTSFSSDITAPGRSRIFQLSRGNFDAFLSAYDAFYRRWITTGGPKHEEVAYAVKEALTKYASPFGETKEEHDARIAQIRTLLKKPKASIADITKSVEDMTTLLAARARGELRFMPYNDPKITNASWADFSAWLQTQWGGMEYMPDLFTETGDDPESVARAPILSRLDAPSLVLFSPTSVLGPGPPQSHLRAILMGVNQSARAAPGVPVYRFGTSGGELRVLGPEPEPSGAANAAAASSPPTGKGRRRTRRRMFKNPKTLKKRIR